MIEKYISVAALRLGMSNAELTTLTGYNRSKIGGLVTRLDAQASDDDRRPADDPVAGRARIERELPTLTKLHADADALVEKTARICVLDRKMSANELARRTGHSRDFTQKWVKIMRAEQPVVQTQPAAGWHTPSWDDVEPVDEKYVVPHGSAPYDPNQRSMSGVPTMMDVDPEEFWGTSFKESA